jgi:hypothetical protein
VVDLILRDVTQLTVALLADPEQCCQGLNLVEIPISHQDPLSSRPSYEWNSSEVKCLRKIALTKTLGPSHPRPGIGTRLRTDNVTVEPAPLELVTPELNPVGP